MPRMTQYKKIGNKDEANHFGFQILFWYDGLQVLVLP